MNLKEYLKANDCTVSRASRALKITRTHLSTIVHGTQNASYHLAKAIEVFTQGEIKAESLTHVVDPRKRKQKPRKPNE